MPGAEYLDRFVVPRPLNAVVIRPVETDLIAFYISEDAELVMKLPLIQLVARQRQLEIEDAVRHHPCQSGKAIMNYEKRSCRHTS